MSKRALKKAVKKWKKIVKGNGADKGKYNCALCKKYIDTDVSCRGCPVVTTTRTDGCRGTPYEAWEEHHINIHLNLTRNYENRWVVKVRCPVCMDLAKAELEFLKRVKRKVYGG